MMMVIMLGGGDYDDDAAPKPGRAQLYGTASLSTAHPFPFPLSVGSTFPFLSFPFLSLPPLSSAPQPPKSRAHRLRGNGMDERCQAAATIAVALTSCRVDRVALSPIRSPLARVPFHNP
jgi:hypothetical protein